MARRRGPRQRVPVLRVGLVTGRWIVAARDRLRERGAVLADGAATPLSLADHLVVDVDRVDVGRRRGGRDDRGLGERGRARRQGRCPVARAAGVVRGQPAHEKAGAAAADADPRRARRPVAWRRRPPGGSPACGGRRPSAADRSHRFDVRAWASRQGSHRHPSHGARPQRRRCSGGGGSRRCSEDKMPWIRAGLARAERWAAATNWEVTT